MFPSHRVSPRHKVFWDFVDFLAVVPFAFRSIPESTIWLSLSIPPIRTANDGWLPAKVADRGDKHVSAWSRWPEVQEPTLMHDGDELLQRHAGGERSLALLFQNFGQRQERPWKNTSGCFSTKDSVNMLRGQNVCFLKNL